jgi:hypothetical protein
MTRESMIAPTTAHMTVIAKSSASPSPAKLGANLSIRLLSPSDAKLSKLLPEWNAELANAHLCTTDPDEIELALARGRGQLGVLNVDFLAGEPFKLDHAKPSILQIYNSKFSGVHILSTLEVRSSDRMQSRCVHRKPYPS